jgi:pyridoxal phosphate enzyme (YggS family)
MAQGPHEEATDHSRLVADRLSVVLDRVAAAASRAGRNPSEVTLVAVSKGMPAEAIRAAYRAGHRDFGENRAGELAAKAPELPGDIVWHFIGTLQTRQVRLARPHTSLLHSLDRIRLVRAWAGGGEKTPAALIQVNVAGEEQKHGVAPSGVQDLLNAATAAGIECRGLMTIPPNPDDSEASRPWFASLREIQSRLQPEFPALRELSMGMTDDFEVAIEEGATMIRVGRAIFGPRPQPIEGD